MACALLQLVSCGAEDIPLTSDPEMTFFKSVYKQYTKFSMESMENLFVDKPKFGSMNVLKIKRYGDLISDIYLDIMLPHDPNLVNSYWTNRIGFNLLKKVELYIGKILIDRMYGQWCHIWVELTHPIDKKLLIDRMLGGMNCNGYSNGYSATIPHKLTIPLFFSFCRHPGLALPLIAIRNNMEITLKFFFEKKSECIQRGELPKGDIYDATVWVEYVFMEKDQQNLYAQTPLEYVFESIQHYTQNLIIGGTKNIALPFNLPCKELMWVVRKKYTNNLNYINIYGDKFTDFTCDHIYSMVKHVQFKFNSFNVFSSGPRANDYFNYVIPYQCHSGNPDLGINAYSFALYPESIEASGIINFLHLKSANINISAIHNGLLDMYAVCYNVIKFKDGDFELIYN